MKYGIKDCVNEYAKTTGCTKAEAERAVKTTLEVLKNAIVNHGGVSIIGMFNLEVKERAERQGRNPHTGEAVTIPASKVLKMTVGKSLKEAINK